MKKDYKELCIGKGASMLQAMEQMDRVRHKLLMVMEGDSFIGAFLAFRVFRVFRG